MKAQPDPLDLPARPSIRIRCKCGAVLVRIKASDASRALAYIANNESDSEDSFPHRRLICRCRRAYMLGDDAEALDRAVQRAREVGTRDLQITDLIST
jgi:hypothetical protein